MPRLARGTAWRRLMPASLAVDVPHGVTSFLEFAEDLGDELASEVPWAVIFDPLKFDINPESKNSGQPEIHYVPSIAARFC